MPNTTGIKFLYQDSVGAYKFDNPGSNVLSVTSQATGDHGKVNLTTTPLRETWRSATVASWQEIIIAANDVNVIPDTFALLNHNLTEIAVVQLQGSTSPTFNVIGFTLGITWAERHMVLQQDIGQAYPYYRIRILDPTNPCGYIEIGRIIGGKSFYMTNNEDITDDFSISPADKAYKMPTEGFFRAFNERVKVDKLQIRFDKLWTTNTPSDPNRNYNYKELLKMFKEVGETYPFLTILDPEDAAFETIWGVVDALPTRTHTVNRYVTMSFAIQEQY